MLQTFFAELKRRKVLRVVGAYAVVAWGALQVADKLFPALMLPAWTITLVAGAAVRPADHGGHRVGVRADARWTQAHHGGLRSRDDGRQRRRRRGRAAGRDPRGRRRFVHATDAARGTERARSRKARQSPPDSIAVLPFTSFSDDADSNYFVDGLTEELINNLANIPGLKVSGRTSSFYFKNRNEDLREIGRALGVAHVLEGSVRRSGDKLRITVQLISTADGFHLWSQTYDRGMAEIFAIQDDVANNVASVLEVKLAPNPKRRQCDGTKDYRLYLIARTLLHERALEPLTQAREIFSRLKDHAPDNVDALAGYAQATMLLAGSFLTLDFVPAAKDAIAALEHALAIDPDSVPANVAAGQSYTILLHRTGETRYRELAERALAHAVELAPDDPKHSRRTGCC